jgi:anti-sigma-K factor RskA
MTDDSYPGLYRCADAASLKAQRAYLRFHRVYLGSLVLGSATSAFTALGTPSVNTWLYTALAIILVVGLLILWAMRARQDDKVWFDGRAIAESVKTVTWRFMMRVKPFQEDGTAENLFVSELKEIREARPHLGKHLAAAMDADGSAITDFMREKRSGSIEDRRGFYISDRVRDQKTWYSRKAKMNVENSAQWFWVIAALQIVIVILAIVQAVSGGLGVNIVPVVTTCVAVFAAWSQIKRHDELAQSYALAAQELGELETIASNQTSEDAFSQLVEQAENSISREHTMWCARRDVRLSRAAGANPKAEGQAHG